MLRRGLAFGGMVAEGMVRGSGWSFLQFGRRLEHALFSLRSVQACCGQGMTPDKMHLRLALELGDALITYRNRYLSVLQPRPVLDLLLNDETNPRSLLFQLDAMERHTQAFPSRPQGMPDDELAALKTQVGQVVDSFIADQNPGVDESVQLDGQLFDVEQRLMAIAEHISRVYFIHSQGERLLGADWRPSNQAQGSGQGAGQGPVQGAGQGTPQGLAT